MPIQYKSCVLFVKDIQKANTFYQNILEQKIEFDFGTNIGYTGGLAIWEIPEKHEIEGIKNMDSTGVKIEVYFETEDLASLNEQLKKEGIRLLHDIKTERWGQQTIRFFDPDNHLIEVGEPLKTFITRIYMETNSIEETSKKTGTPVELVKGFVE